MLELIVATNYDVTAPDNPSQSDRDNGQGGGAARILPIDDDPGNELGRFEWTEQLRDDLLFCYQESVPTQRGYMTRMHSLWSGKHPEYQNFSKQKLRDYVAYLRRSGYIRTPYLQQHIETLPKNPIEEFTTQDNDAQLSERKINIRNKIYIKPQELARANERLRNEISENINIETLNNTVYRFASDLVPEQHNSESNTSIRIKRRIEQVKRKIYQTRQQASRIQCVTEYITTQRPFTKKLESLLTLCVATIKHSLMRH